MFMPIACCLAGRKIDTAQCGVQRAAERKQDMRNYPTSRFSRAFTIIELLVVVSIIALLVGILLPAIGKAREQAQLTRSQANVTQLGKAAVTYAAEYADRQLTFCNDNLSKYGTGAASVTNYNTQVGYAHPPVILGYGQGGVWGYWMPGNPVGNAGNWEVAVPMAFSTKFGSFRLPNARQFATYLNGRFYDSSFYAPKDTAVFASVEEAFDQPDEYTNLPGQVRWSSYCFSPAGMFSPDVLGKNTSTGLYYTDPFTIQSGHRSPSMSQARNGTLKSHIMEHNWNQNRKKICNPAFNPGTYLGCEPYYYNASYDSTPVTLFYDGHVGSIGCRTAMEDCLRASKQGGGVGLWSKDTPLKGVYTDYGNDGYYSTQGVDWTSTSFHILTTDGILGRDVLPH
jgi:prepilin-type N-terminal cleavage/methylation domain-containing protein